MRMRYIILFILYINLDGHEGATLQKMFSREVQVTTMDLSFSENSAIKGYMQMRKFNRTHIAYNYNCTITRVVDHRFRYELEVKRWSDGGWKNNVVTYKSSDPCKGIKYTLGVDFENMMVRSNHPKNCPFVPGFYGFKDYCIEAKRTPLIIKPGVFRLNVDIFEKEMWQFRLAIDATVKDVY